MKVKLIKNLYMLKIFSKDSSNKYYWLLLLPTVFKSTHLTHTEYFILISASSVGNKWFIPRGLLYTMGLSENAVCTEGMSQD